MNRRLRIMRDGAHSTFMVTANYGVLYYSGEIYWPFALHITAKSLFGERAHGWSITHLPSGYRVKENMRRSRARRLIERLRSLDTNWNFTKPHGDTWEATKKIVSPIVQNFRAT